MDTDTITIYRSRSIVPGKRGWRWRWSAAGNHARLANGGQAYSSLVDLLSTLTLHVLGLDYPTAREATTVLQTDNYHIVVHGGGGDQLRQVRIEIVR